jgi:predicted transcriptional regulator
MDREPGGDDAASDEFEAAPDEIEAALEEIEFLALSANRVAVLRLLADGGRTRSELASETGASQATLGRILGDFEDRSWIERRGGAYAATATGRLVARGFGDLLDIFATERSLRDIVAYLPADELTFDLRRLADATVVTPSGTRPDAPLQRLLDMEAEADEIRAFSHAFNDRSLSLTERRVREGELTFYGVFSQGAIDALASDDELRRTLASMLDADGASIRVCDDGISLAGSVVDGDVHLLVRDDDGVLRASIDTDDAEVRDWAERTFEAYWEAATPINRADLLS